MTATIGQSEAACVRVICGPPEHHVNTVAEWEQGLAAHVQTLLSDIPNYTNIEPQIQISEVVQ